MQLTGTRAAGLVVMVGGVAFGFAPRVSSADGKAQAKEVTVAEVRAEAFDKAIKAHKDKVVVVDFWATWCAPCVKKFPHLVEMHKKYADKGLVCMSVSMDLLGSKDDYKKDKVLAFLKDKGAAFPNFVTADPDADGEKMEKTFGEDFRLIPYLVVFDKAGRRVWDSSNGPKMTDEQLEKKIEELLAK